MVKNQIGVILAEQGRVIDGVNYFLAASDLEPREPLYHFQIGLLLSEGRGDFLKSKAWTREVLDKTMLAAFARAAELAPERVDFAYRAAESYYDLVERVGGGVSGLDGAGGAPERSSGDADRAFASGAGIVERRPGG